MVSLNHQQHLRAGIARSHSSASVTPSKKVSANSLTASDPDLAKQLYKANVKVAIDDRISGTSSKYDDLCAKFASPNSSAIELCQYLAALSHFVTRLEAPQFTSLVRAIVSLNWIGYPPALTQVYIQFLGALATAQTNYLPLMLKQLLGELADVTLVPNARRTDLQRNAHWAIQHLLDVVPSGTTILLQLIRESFPHPTADRREQISYVFNLIRMCHYVQNLKGEILSICVQRAVQLDVQIQFELNRLDDDLEEELLSNQFEGTEYSSEDDINTEPPNIDDATESSSGILDINTSLTTLRDTITTLDALMTTLFTYIDPLFPTDSEPSLEAEQLFDSLLSTFLLHILPTYHSRHAQFLVFKTSQSHSLFLDKFLGLLIERSLNPTISNIGRQASSAYLASFVARAKSLTPDTIKTVVEMLCVFLSRVLEDMPITAQGKFIPGGVAGNRGLDGVYSVFQAVIYIYCFRWRELQTVDEESGEHIWLPQLNVIQRMAWSPLNPLAHISPDVAQEFAQRSYNLQHIFVHSILKENARKGVVAGFLNHELSPKTRRIETVTTGEMVIIHSMPSTSEDEGPDDEGLAPKDWYPFDPYALPRSKDFVTSCFVEYTPADEEDDLDTDEEGTEDGDYMMDLEM